MLRGTTVLRATSRQKRLTGPTGPTAVTGGDPSRLWKLYFDPTAHEAFTCRPISELIATGLLFLPSMPRYVRLLVVISHGKGGSQ